MCRLNKEGVSFCSIDFDPFSFKMSIVSEIPLYII